jgi:hypothetical protein
MLLPWELNLMHKGVCAMLAQACTHIQCTHMCKQALHSLRVDVMARSNLIVHMRGVGVKDTL